MRVGIEMTDTLVRHSLVLVPARADDVQKLLDYSLSLFKGADAEYICGLNSYPHISVLQIETSQARLIDLQSVLKKLPSFRCDVVVSGFYARPENAQVLWTGLEIEHCAALHDFHLAAAEVVTAAGYQITNKAGADYWPHITTARLHTPLMIDGAKLSSHVLAERPITMAAEDGPSGTRWRYLKELTV